MKKYKLEDNEVCKECGHIGKLHGYSKGCKAVTNLDGYFAEQCGCKIRRNLDIDIQENRSEDKP